MEKKELMTEKEKKKDEFYDNVVNQYKAMLPDAEKAGFKHYRVVKKIADKYGYTPTGVIRILKLKKAYI